MRKIPYIPLALAVLTACASCITENIEQCPPAGSVEVILRAEKFRTHAPYRVSDFEPEFSQRIHSLGYLLYDNDELVGEGPMNGLARMSGGSYIFRLDTLPVGSYRLVFVGNATRRMLAGNADDPEECYIEYQGETGGDDHFRADLPFEVGCTSPTRYETVLTRVYGVTRFTFENVPDGVGAIEVTLDNVGERMPLCGDPDVSCEVSKVVPVAQARSLAAASCTLGTFCTPPGEKSSWKLKMYGAEGGAPLYDRVVTDTLDIECNQLLDLKIRFEDSNPKGDIEFTVEVDRTWEGSNGTEGGIAGMRAFRAE